MLLAIDVGNTNIVYGLFDGERLVHKFRVESARGRTADEYAVTLRSLLVMHGVDPKSVDAAIVACVVPSLTDAMMRLVRSAFGREALVVGPGIRSGMAILIENPREVGADRIADAVAGFDKAKGGVIVVDFGTSTNFDVVSSRGEFLGGSLAPGIEISVEALAARAAQLRRVELVRPRSVIGKNTVECLQSGVLYGFAGQVDGLVRRIIGEIGPVTAVVATGGLAPIVVAESETITHHDPDLTLVGLRLVYERNV